MTVNDDKSTVTIANKKIIRDVVLTKTDKETGERLAGAVFELQQKVGAGPLDLKTVIQSQHMIDNNQVENAIRPTAIGKKNWLFIGEAEAGQRSAVLYTIIEACRCRGIDPWTYLRDVLTRLPTLTNWQVKDVTPEAWAKARSNAKRLAA